MTKEIEELYLAAKHVMTSVRTSTADGYSRVATEALYELENAMSGYDLAQARAARKEVKK